MNILSIETSCDETAVAVVSGGTQILSSVVATSASFHQQFGGILPELASRKQLEFMLPTLIEALNIAFPSSYKPYNTHAYLEAIKKNIDAIAVTQGPGLIGSLLIGVETAKTISFLTQKPLIPVNHVLAHIYANMLQDSNHPKVSEIKFPAIALVASGGHTELFLMNTINNWQWLAGTIDDAAGEAFDKTARLLGFQNEGGKAIEEAARKYDKNKLVTLPRPLLHDQTLNFSFSGLKTAVANAWKKEVGATTNPSPEIVSAFAHEIQESITDVLVTKTIRAAREFNANSILLSGGVAANLRLREKFHNALLSQPTHPSPTASEGKATHHSQPATHNSQPATHNSQPTTNNLQLFFPPTKHCTDNAVSIGAFAYFYPQSVPWQEVSAIPNLSVEKSNSMTT